MDQVKAMLAFAVAAGLVLPGIAIAGRIWTNDDMAWAALLGLFVLFALALVFLIRRQEERVLHLKREDQLDRALLGRAAHIQLLSAGLLGGPKDPNGGDWEDELAGMLARTKKLSTSETVDVNVREVT